MSEIQKGIAILVEISGIVGAVAIVLALVEGIVIKFFLKKDYSWKSAFSSYALRAVRVFFLGVPLILTYPLGDWIARLTPINLTGLGLWSYIILFVGFEVGYYVRHRLAHSIRWFWLSHSVHHTPNEFNLSVAFRVEWTHQFMGAYLFHIIPMALLGFNSAAIIGSLAFFGVLGLWYHAEWIPKLGPLEYVLNTPSAHRVHHARNPEYMRDGRGSNFGATVIILDRLFGTYKEERDDVVIDYGLVDRLESHNPFTVTFHLFGKAFRDVRQMKTFGEGVQYFFSSRKATNTETVTSNSTGDVRAA